MATTRPTAVRWGARGASLVILDQTRLPEAEVELELSTLDEVLKAIRTLQVRGAPLIGIVAAMGVAAAARASAKGGGGNDLAPQVAAWCDHLEAARPTAVNLAWALGRMRRVAAEWSGGDAESPEALADALHAEAQAIWDEDREMCRRIGEHGVALLADGARVHTHCNAGMLATGGVGTALAPVYLAHERGTPVSVYADETRPLLQGSRLTAWELGRAGIDVTVLADNAAAALFGTHPPDVVFVGADRIAANGDVANKVGTYGLAVLARRHGVPFYVLAPTSTVDLDTPTGADIPIEHRDPDEVRRGFGSLTAPADVAVYSPAFDVTPAELITGIITEWGIHGPPFGSALTAAVAGVDVEVTDGSVRDVPRLTEEVIRAGRRLNRVGLIAGVAGNLSVRLPSERILITRRGTDKGALDSGDLLVVHLGDSADAPAGASSELPFHRACYEASSDVAAVVHAHAPALVALEVRGLEVGATLPEVEAATGPIATVPFLGSGSEALGSAIGAAVRKGSGVVVLRHHGAVAVGADLNQALQRMELAELAAYTVLLTVDGAAAVRPERVVGLTQEDEEESG